MMQIQTASIINWIILSIEDAAQRAVSVNTYDVIYGRALSTKNLDLKERKSTQSTAYSKM